MNPIGRRVVFRRAIDKSISTFDLCAHYTSFDHWKRDVSTRDAKPFVVRRIGLTGWDRCKKPFALFFQASFEEFCCRHLIGIRRKQECAIVNVILSVADDRQGDVNVGLLFRIPSIGRHMMQHKVAGRLRRISHLRQLSLGANNDEFTRC
ncbi:hypothetical protein ATE59_11385 [Sphingopyxis sp. A083]|nr:hypothetical protein EBMC1_06689 [Sphingopyxis sp. MC1]KTE76087.1 hypothetical protein ATE59_11385 [Sphingopyxis sp. A083]